jgi:hypothetical protein
MIYAKISLRHGSTYIQPLDELDVFIEEIRQGAEYGAVGAVWTVELVEMSEEEYAELPGFAGH